MFGERTYRTQQEKELRCIIWSGTHIATADFRGTRIDPVFKGIGELLFQVLSERPEKVR